MKTVIYPFIFNDVKISCGIQKPVQPQFIVISPLAHSFKQL